MQQQHELLPQDRIPVAGYRARRFRRFEQDLQEWLATPEGRFAVWRAQVAVTAVPTVDADDARD